MKIYFCTSFFLLISFSLSANDYLLLECDQLGTVYSRNYILTQPRSDSEKYLKTHEKARLILEKSREIVNMYDKLDNEQKMALYVAVCKGIERILSYQKIGSGNIVVYSILTDLRICLLQDLLESEVYKNKILSQNMDKSNPAISKNDFLSMLKNEFHNDEFMKNESELGDLLLIILSEKSSTSEKSHRFEKYLFVGPASSMVSMQNVFSLLDDVNYFSITHLFSIYEIRNAFVFSGLALHRNKAKLTLQEKYSLFYQSMNNLQREMFGNKEPEIALTNPRIYETFDVNRFAQFYLRKSDPESLEYLKKRLIMEYELKILQ